MYFLTFLTEKSFKPQISCCFPSHLSVYFLTFLTKKIFKPQISCCFPSHLSVYFFKFPLNLLIFHPKFTDKQSISLNSICDSSKSRLNQGCASKAEFPRIKQKSSFENYFSQNHFFTFKKTDPISIYSFYIL